MHVLFLLNATKMIMLCFFQGGYIGRAGKEENQKSVCIQDWGYLPKHCFNADSRAMCSFRTCKKDMLEKTLCLKTAYCFGCVIFFFVFQGSHYKLKDYCKHPCASLTCWKYLHHLFCCGSIPKVRAYQKGIDSLGKK